MRLEELTKGMVVEGVEPGGPVTVVDASPLGDGAVELVYRNAAGGAGFALLYRHNEAGLRISGEVGYAFDGDGRLFRLAAEAYRLKMAHLFDPRLAVHASQIDPLPHQISAVYERMLPRQPLRFLLADDPGAGKTVMAGLLMKELGLRGDLERCLVCCPGSLVEQWQDELWQKFGLPFEIVAREQIEASRSGNPFAEGDMIICRLDHLRRDEVREKLEGTDWDLIVADEAHKMSASFSGGEVRRTKRYALGETLSRISRHFLLMTATPHNGKEEDFQLFLRLLDADRFEGRFRSGKHRTGVEDLMRRMVKEDLKKFDGTRLFPERYAYTVGYELSPEEAALYEEVTAYVRDEFDRAEAAGGRVRTVGFALTVLQRRLASSPEAIYRSLVRRRERLEERLREARKVGGAVVEEPGLGALAGRLEDPDELLAEEQEETEEQVVDLATAARNAWELEAEIETLKRLEERARGVRSLGRDRKWDELARLLGDEELMRERDGRPRKMIVFTEHRDTLGYLEGRLARLRGSPGSIVSISGGMRREERQRAQERFLNDPEVTLLLATDAAGEGVNLQRANLMVNYDLPWNPNRLEQRFGRIHRIGQTEDCHLWNLVADGTREGDVYRRLLEKLEEARRALGGKVFDVLGEMFRERQLRELLIEAVRHGRGGGAGRRAVVDLESALEHERLRELIEEQALTHEVMDPATLGRIREEMERAEARKLQPHFVASFFLEAARLFGGSPKEREPGRYELKKVPGRLFEEARRMPGGSRLSDSYERITFDKALRDLEGAPRAKFLYPGHPLLDAAVKLVLDRCGGVLKKGAVLVDEADASGAEPRTLVLLEHVVHDGRLDRHGNRRVASRRMQFVELWPDGEARGAGFAPYLDYRPLRKDELGLIPRLGTPSGGVGEQARRYAAARIVPEHLAEVRAEREAQVARVRAAVQERLTREISFWDRRSAQLRQRERMVGEDARRGDRLNSENAARRRDELISRRERRMEELDRELHLMPASPVVVGAARIVPAGLLRELSGDTSSDGFARDPEATKRVEELAMEAVAEAETALGNTPRSVAEAKIGYDIESKDAKTGRLRMIEVKGRAKGAATVTVTRNEILTALNRPEDFILALVEVDGDKALDPRYVRRPFAAEPDFGATSVNYDLKKLLEDSEPPS